MLAVAILVGPKDQGGLYSWISVNDELKLCTSQLVELENKLLLVQKYVASERIRAQTEESLLDRPSAVAIDSEEEKKTHEIERQLECTVEKINTMGLIAFLNADKKRRNHQVQSLLKESLLTFVGEGAYNLKPITGDSHRLKIGRAHV